MLTNPSVQARPAVAGLQLNQTDWQKIDKGKIFTRLIRNPKQNFGKVYVIGTVGAERPRVWKTLTDTVQLPGIYPGILELKVKGRKLPTETRFIKLDFPWPLQDRWLVSKIKFNKNSFRQDWQRIDGSILKDTGQWQLHATGQNTLMVYWTTINPGLDFVPDWAIRHGMQNSAPDVIRNLRKYLKSKL